MVSIGGPVRMRFNREFGGNMKLNGIPFPFLKVPERAAKPRKSGLTIFADINLSVREVEDLMEHQAEMLDYVKFVDHGALIARYDSSWIRRKVDIYHAERNPGIHRRRGLSGCGAAG